ncbi:MAG: sulfurtransferase complex subunit TusC [Gammaproteobacteria bacterium]
MSSVLFLVRSAPAGSLRAREALDAALLFSAFMPRLAVLFSGDGVWQLLAGQQAAATGAVPVAPVVGALPEYDIEQVFADAGALAERGIDRARLLPGVQLLDDDGIRALLCGYDRVLTF